MHDLLVRGGRLVDGTGRAGYTADVAIRNGIIVDIGKITGSARDVIDAHGALVTPGFIDVHTHYDGQFLWDDQMDPSFSNGVTTAIAGNCGVGFAPVRNETRQQLVELMEGVEDIPAAVIEQGLDWRWTSFADYLRCLSSRRYAMDVAAHLPHAALRTFVMGDRALSHEAASSDDLASMAALVREAMEAGAMGVSCGRILEHRSSTGGYVPGTFAADEEFLCLARAMGQAGSGVFQINPKGMIGDTMMLPDLGREERLAEHDRIKAIARASGRPVTYLFLQYASDLDDWRVMLGESEKANAEGLAIYPQTSARGVGITSTLEGQHRFMLRPSYMAIAHLPLAQRLAAMRDPERRRAILGEADRREAAGSDANLLNLIDMLNATIRSVFPLSLPLDYEPGAEKRLGALADAAGMSEEAYLYDHLTAGDGRNVIATFGCNYIEGNLDAVREMLLNPRVISGLGDGGAHMKFICDSSLPSFQLTFWTRDRRRGPRIAIETMVRKMSKDCADLYGLTDRGTIEIGKRADLNVIDHDRLALCLPEMRYDLPSGAPRLVQGAVGYLATLVAGRITRRNDRDTGARPGGLARSRVPAGALN